jgi:carbamate kinase
MTAIAVVAVGGNALTAADQSGTSAEIETNAAEMAGSLADLVRSGWQVAVVHGNGPQVGNLAMQQDALADVVPAQPLHQLCAMTQGQLGSVLVRAIDRECGPGSAACVVTHVGVDPQDPAFDHPTKPIGPFFPEGVARQLAQARRWTIAEDAGRGFRRVVASPVPKGFVEIDAIRSLLDAGHVVVTGGGGGIPVGRRGEVWDGVDAVIDKDYAAAELASQLQAEALVLITAVDAVQLDFGKATQRPLTWVGPAEAERHLEAGQFPPGSMGPKVRAAISFIRRGGERAVITAPPLVVATLSSDEPDDRSLGTLITSVSSRHGAPA